jgi:altronate dehydratase
VALVDSGRRKRINKSRTDPFVAHLREIIAVASGEKTKSELAGIGDEEFAPWILGPNF